MSLCCIYKSKCKFSRKLPPGEIGLGGEDVNWGFEASQLNVKVSPLGSLADVLPPPVAAVNVLRRRASPVTFIFWKFQEKTALPAVDGIVWFSTFSLHCGSNIQTTQPPPSVNFVFYRMVFFNCSSQFSVPKWKMMGSQSEILFHEILDVQMILVGWITFFFFCTEIWAVQLKKAPCISRISSHIGIILNLVRFVEVDDLIPLPYVNSGILRHNSGHAVALVLAGKRGYIYCPIYVTSYTRL